MTVPYTNETLKTVFTSTVKYRYFTVLAGYRFSMCVLGPYDGYVNAVEGGRVNFLIVSTLNVFVRRD